MAHTPTPDFAEAMGRIQLVTGCRTQSELAKFLGIRQSSVADAKKRGNIPSDWLLTLCRKLGVNPDWISTGEGAKRLQPVDSLEDLSSEPTCIKEIRLPEECSVEELIFEVVRRENKSNK